MQNTITISVSFRSILFCIVLFRAVLSDEKTRCNWIRNSFSMGISEDDEDHQTETYPAMLHAALKAHAKQASKFHICVHIVQPLP